MTASTPRHDRPTAPDGGSGGVHPGDDDGYLTRAELAERFDLFYRESRDRLFVQALALTGDPAAARAGVREAYVVAWHHWRKVASLPDPEMYVRPLAWRRAQRRASARPLRRRRDVDDEGRRVLDALATLSGDQRRALLLTQLAAVTMEEMAHEVGLTLEAAERELQWGAANLALRLDIPTSSIPLALAGLGRVLERITWPRVTIVRRAGRARRRAHTAAGTVAALAAVVVGGAITADAGGAYPSLAREGTGDRPAPTTTTTPTGTTLPESGLLELAAVDTALASKGWQQGETSDNSAGNGLVLPCQATRYADPRGTAAWVRTFTTGEGPETRKVVQFAEASTRVERAERIYARTLGWFTSCAGPTPGAAAAGEEITPPRVQLISTADVVGVGDQATLLLMRDQTGTASHLVGVARTGLFTVTVALTTPTASEKVKRDGALRLLAAAVTPLCSLPGAGACTTAKPTLADRAPYPVGAAPWMLSEVDLPPLNADQGPWVGTPVADLTEQRADASAIGCDTASLFREYRGQAVRTNQFRTFVLSTAEGLPTTVGLTQTVGALPLDAATALVARLRDQIAACPERDTSAGTEVAELAREGGKGASALSAWRLTTALPGDKSVEYDVAIVRRGTSLSLLVYVSAPKARIADADFVALARRAQERLAELEG